MTSLKTTAQSPRPGGLNTYPDTATTPMTRALFSIGSYKDH
jgi:hypothetical protein